MVTKKEYKDRIEYRNEKGQYHREDGPAREWNNGIKEWLINGQYHREDGPAIEHPNGKKEWLLYGQLLSEQRWQDKVIKIKLERLKYL